MKSSLRLFAPLVAMGLSLGSISLLAQDAPPPPPPDVSYQGAPPPDQGAPPPDQDGDNQGASFQEFYDQLGSQGNWVQTDDYGYVFQPNVSDPNWAPYTDGNWVYSDAGWVWVSDEPWGWATYHYGRWANIYGTGWVWVPGYEWAPAWVSWRYGGGYCGWAPLPPGTFIGAEYADPGIAIGIGFHFGGDVDVAFNIGPGCYNFVPVNYMGYSNYRGHYLDRSRNFVVINNTTNITNININRNGGATAFRSVAVGGPPINEINAHVATPIRTVRLTSAYQPGRATLNGNTLAVFAPHVNPTTARTARPANVAQTISHPTFNRGDSITKPLAVNSHLQPTAPTEAQVAAAKEAISHASPKAKIATEKTVARTSVTRPLSSMQAVAHTPATTNTNAYRPATTQAGVQHTAASPYTGEQTTRPATSSEVHSTGSPYTGETTTGERGSPYTGESNTQRSNVERSTEPSYTGQPSTVQHSPYTGEPGTTHESTSNEERSVQHESQPAPSYQQRETTPSVQHQPTPAPISHQAAPAERQQGGGGNGAGNNKNQNGAYGGPGSGTNH
jgi:hypothetical protein